MSYRVLSKIYPLCEGIVFGRALQRARTAFSPSLSGKILSIGEGDGRGAALLPPACDLTILENDPHMRAEARKRLSQAQWITCWEEAKKYDVILMSFLLDCCSPEDASNLIKRAAAHLKKDGRLIIADFFPEEVHPSWLRPPAHLLTRVMYLFFRIITGLQTSTLPPIRTILATQNWVCEDEYIQWHGYIRTQKWQRMKLN